MLDSTLPPERPPRDQLLALFQERLGAYGFVAPEVAAQVTGPEQIDFRALHWLLLASPWHSGRALLLGDAAHTTTPHLAFGVGLAIEDAVVLSELVAEGLEGAELGERYAARRYERCRLVVESSLQLSRWEQAPGTPGADPAALMGQPSASWPSRSSASASSRARRTGSRPVRSPGPPGGSRSGSPRCVRRGRETTRRRG